MTKKEAINLLYSCWGNQQTITHAQIRQVSTVGMASETAIDTCLRIAEIEFDWRAVHSCEERASKIWELVLASK